MSVIFIGSDHAGVLIRTLLADTLQAEGHEIHVFGPAEGEKSDYPEAARAVCSRVLATPDSFGILVCGTGIGMSMAANRLPGIRAALCSSEFHAKACREHNNANVLCLGERVTGPGLALAITKVFFSTDFEGGRHQRRVQMFDNGLN